MTKTLPKNQQKPTRLFRQSLPFIGKDSEPQKGYFSCSKTVLVTDRGSDFWSCILPTILQYLLVLVNLYFPPSIPPWVNSALPSLALCPGLPCSDSLIPWTQDGFGQWQALAGEWGPGKKEAGVLLPHFLCALGNVFQQWLYPSITSTYRKFSLSGALCSWDTTPTLCLFRSGVTTAHFCWPLGASPSPVNPSCPTVKVPPLNSLETSKFNCFPPGSWCMPVCTLDEKWTESEKLVLYFYFYNEKCFFYFILYHTKKFLVSIKTLYPKVHPNGQWTYEVCSI